MTAETMKIELDTARKHAAIARSEWDRMRIIHADKPTSRNYKAFMEAANNLEFWNNKTAFLSNARPESI